MGKYWTDKTDGVDEVAAIDFNEAFKAIEEDIATQGGALNNHLENENNPHNVTAAQVGLGNVDNVQQAAKVDFDAHKTDAEAHPEAFALERTRFNPLYANALKGSASGNNITVTDSVEGTPVELTLYGATTEVLADKTQPKSPDNPAEITGVGESGSVTVTVSGADGTTQDIAVPLDSPLYKLDARPGFESDPEWNGRTDGINGAKIIRRTVREEFDGTEAWYQNGEIKDGLVRYFLGYRTSEAYTGGRPNICSHFKYDTLYGAQWYVENYCVFYSFADSSEAWFGICVSAERFPTVDDFKAWLAEQAAAGTPVSVIHPINPIETDITDTEAGQALLALVSQNGSTYTNSENADMKITYNRDINKAFEGLQNAITTMNIAMINNI